MGRTLVKTAKGSAFINDPSYADDLANIFGFNDGSKGVATPAVNDSIGETGAAGALDGATGTSALDPGRARMLRAAVGKLLWLAHDRPDIKFAVGRLAADAANPTEETWNRAKRVARCLRGAPLGATMLEPRGGGD